MNACRVSPGALVEHGDRLRMRHHLRPGRYDFCGAPGGGVQGEATDDDAARHEVWEETGLCIAVARLLDVEDLVNPASRCVQFRFAGHIESGGCDTSRPEAQQDRIVDVP